MKTLFRIVMPFYIYLVLYVTLLNRSEGVSRFLLTPFWEYRSMLESRNYYYWLGQICGNIIMLMPFGFMLPIVSDRCKSGLITVSISFLFSLFIEVAQYTTGRGLMEFDDLFNNTFGGLIGFMLYRFLLDRSD